MELQIGVKILLCNPEGKYLFIKRTELLEGEKKTSWDIPGGRIEPHESLQEGLRREVNEEIGIELEGTPRLVDAQDIFISSKNRHVVRLTYLLATEQESSAIKLSDEHSSFTWLTAEEVEAEPYLAKTLSSIALSGHS